MLPGSLRRSRTRPARSMECARFDRSFRLSLCFRLRPLRDKCSNACSRLFRGLGISGFVTKEMRPIISALANRKLLRAKLLIHMTHALFKGIPVSNRACWSSAGMNPSTLVVGRLATRKVRFVCPLKDFSEQEQIGIAHVDCRDIPTHFAFPPGLEAVIRITLVGGRTALDALT